jgi:hypothetical protein
VTLTKRTGSLTYSRRPCVVKRRGPVSCTKHRHREIKITLLHVFSHLPEKKRYQIDDSGQSQDEQREDEGDVSPVRSVPVILLSLVWHLIHKIVTRRRRRKRLGQVVDRLLQNLTKERFQVIPGLWSSGPCPLHISSKQGLDLCKLQEGKLLGAACKSLHFALDARTSKLLTILEDCNACKGKKLSRQPCTPHRMLLTAPRDVAVLKLPCLPLGRLPPGDLCLEAFDPNLEGLIHLMPKSELGTFAVDTSFDPTTFTFVLLNMRVFSSSSTTVCWSRNARCGSRCRVLGSEGFDYWIPQCCCCGALIQDAGLEKL